MKQQTFTGRKKDGDFKIYRRKDMQDLIDTMEDGEYELTISKKKKKSSDEQRGFYFDCFLQEQIDCFKEFWGETYTKKAMHQWNKDKFWGEEKIHNGEIIMMPGTSTDKSTVEWEEVLEKIRQWFRLTFDWEISYPDHQKGINFKKYGI